MSMASAPWFFRRFSADCARLGLAAFCLIGCASTGTATRSDAETKEAIERLRAENAANVRKVEELSNQVFILNSELETRRAGEPALGKPEGLPEVKLAPGRGKDPAPESEASPPVSLVDEAEVEYVGAAAERGVAKRPVLKLWGTDADDEAVAQELPDPPARRHLSARRPRQVNQPLPLPQAGSRLSPPAPRAHAGAVAMTPAPSSPNDPHHASGANGSVAAYQAALVHLRAGRHDEAVASLRAFVAAHPQHDLADNAQYWLGECFYDRKDYSTALREFRRVVDQFPAGNKVPDALLKLGLSYLAIGSERPGREALADIVKKFPEHPAAALAKARLGAAGGDGVSAALVPGAARKEVP